jgi:hypothetical protein
MELHMDDPQAGFDAEKRFNALMKLADFRFQRWRERRATDWKFTLALWAFLVASAASVKIHEITAVSDKINHSLAVTVLLMASLVALVLGHALFWVRNHWISNEMDIRTAFHFAEHAEIIVLPDNVRPKPRLDPEEFKSRHKHGLEFLKAGFPLIQVLGTLFFAWVVFLVLVFG